MGIDWSGALTYTGDPVQIALTDDLESNAEIIPPPEGERRWTRTSATAAIHGLYETLVQTGQRAVVGMDFSFGFPFVDKECYFPGDQVPLPEAKALWTHIENISHHQKDYYASAFYRNEPYARYFLQQPNRRGKDYSPRLRLTESLCRRQFQLHPCSVFSLIGANTVGIGSLAGMRWLQALTVERQQEEIDFRIWPFEEVRSYERLVFVEIYPRLCRRLFGDPVSPKEMPGHQRDALFAAHGVKLICQRPDCWELPGVPEEVLRTEGWIFGVTGNEGTRI